MGRVYTVSFAATAATVAVDFFEINPADDKPCVIHSVEIGQTSDYGDAQAEGLEIKILRGGTGITSGSGGAAATPIGASPSYQAAGAACEVMNTTAATFTAGVTWYDTAFNVQSGWVYAPAPEDRPEVNQANGGLVVRLGGAPADSVTWTGTLVFEELG